MNDNNTTLNDTVVTINLIGGQTIRLEIPRHQAMEIEQWFADDNKPSTMTVRYDYKTVLISKTAVVFISVESNTGGDE